VGTAQSVLKINRVFFGLGKVFLNSNHLYFPTSTTNGIDCISLTSAFSMSNGGSKNGAAFRNLMPFMLLLPRHPSMWH